MKHNPKFIYPKSTRSSVDGHRLYNLGEAKLPSVTIILTATQPPEKRKALAAWRLRVGTDEAARIVDSSATRGTAMHRIIESYLTGQYHLDLTDLNVMNSPYYYIQPNDMIYVKPLRQAVWGAGENVLQSVAAIATILSLITSCSYPM